MAELESGGLFVESIMPMCDTVDVVGAKNVRPYDHGRTRKKPGLFAKRFAKAKVSQLQHAQ